jgi:hypothetical protein
MFVPRPAARICRVLRDDILHAFPRAGFEDGGMLARGTDLFYESSS